MKNFLNILLLSFVLHFFFSETLILCVKSCKSDYAQSIDLSGDTDDSTDNEEQKEDGGKEQTFFSDFSFQELLMLRSYTKSKYHIFKTPNLTAPFQEVAGQPPQA